MMTEEEYKEYYSKVICFHFPFPCSIYSMQSYLAILPHDAVILSTDVVDFGRRTELLIRCSSFPDLKEGVCVPVAEFIVQQQMKNVPKLDGSFGELEFKKCIVPIGWQIRE